MNNQSIDKNKIKTLVKSIFTLCVLFFIAKYLYENYDSIKSLKVVVSYKSILIAVLLYVVYKFNLISLWHYITVEENCSIPFRESFRAYLYSVLGKYIPGKVFLLLARISPYQDKGISSSKITICFFLENAFTFFGASLLFLVSLVSIQNNILGKYVYMVIILILLFFIVLHPTIINKLLLFVGKIINRDLSINLSYKQILKFVLLFFVNWIILGTGFYFLINSIYLINFDKLFFVSGLLGFSVIAGLLAVFAPSGIGVRDGIIAFGLQSIMPQQYAVIISILCRLWMSITELSMVLVCWLINSIRKIER